MSFFYQINAYPILLLSTLLQAILLVIQASIIQFRSNCVMGGLLLFHRARPCLLLFA